MKTAAEIFPGVLTGIKAPSTKDSPANTLSSCSDKTPAKAGKQHPNFSDWKTHNEDSLCKALEIAALFAVQVKLAGAAHDRMGYCLTFCGVSGTGKTFLADCILNELRKNRWGALDGVQGYARKGKVIQASFMSRDWRKVSDGFKIGRFEVVDDLESTFLLLLDDIGADYDPSSIGVSKLDRVLRSRTGKWTILTCNLTLAQISETLDARIASFLIRDGNRVCEINSQDYALRKML